MRYILKTKSSAGTPPQIFHHAAASLLLRRCDLSQRLDEKRMLLIYWHNPVRGLKSRRGLPMRVRQSAGGFAMAGALEIESLLITSP